MIVMMSSAAAALPVGRPIASEHQWRAGVVGAADEMDMQEEGNLNDNSLSTGMLLFEASYGFVRDAELVIRVGGSDESVDGRTSRDIGSGFDWGLGVRGVMYDSYQDWRILGDAQYMSRLSRVFAGADLEIDEWQLAASVDWHLGKYYPYVGASFGEATIQTNNTGIFRKQKSADSIGFHAGLGIEPNLEWSVYVEGQFGRTSGVSGGAHYRF